MEIALSRFCGKADILSPLSKEEEVIRQQFSGLNAQNYRAPLWRYSLYDLLRCTYYHQLKGFWDHADAKEVKSILPAEVWNSYYKFAFDRNPWDKVLSFYHWSNAQKKFRDLEDFLLNGDVNLISSFEQLSINGIIAVDKIYKYEELGRSMDELTDLLHLPEKLRMPPCRVKGEFRQDKRHYREVLTGRQKVIIQQMFAREIAVMGYEY